jgi:hypothetical protein
VPDRAVLTLTVDTSEGRRKFGVFADALKDLTPVLREFDKYKQARIQELFATEGHGKWPARSERTQQRAAKRMTEAAERAPRSLAGKLRRDLGKAQKRLANIDRPNPNVVHVAIGDILPGVAAFEKARRLRSAHNAVARRAFVLEAFERASAGIYAPVSDKEQKQLAKLAPRWERAQGRVAKSGKLMAGLARTIESKIARGLLTIDSSWDSPAPAALQEGATVGRGAKLPPREWLAWEPEDVDVLADLFHKRAMLAWRS